MSHYLKSIQVGDTVIPVNTPCKLNGRITPACRLIYHRDRCSAGDLEQVRCETCNEIVHQEIIR